MPQRLLTDRFCAGAKPRDGEAQTDYFDTQVSGLALRVSEGRKSWTLHYTLGGKRHRLTFGSYPAIALAGARTRADEACAAVASGHDPKSIASETLQAWRKLGRRSRMTMNLFDLLDRREVCRFFGGTRPLNPATL
jgi:Arm DNA-binding domain